MTLNLNHVFVPGGQPTITFVDRTDHEFAKELKKAIQRPSHIVSVSGPSKVGKTVLCKQVLDGKEYVWIDGGKVSRENSFWSLVCNELGADIDSTHQTMVQGSGEVSGKIPLLMTANGSMLAERTLTKTSTATNMTTALKALQDSNIILVIDDFHYIEETKRKQVVRNLKGAIFNGLKVLLLSANHRVFDAIKAEGELTGRFASVSLSAWPSSDLEQIAELGFDALNIVRAKSLVSQLANEAQENPMLMQRFCWELCADNDIYNRCSPKHCSISTESDIPKMFKSVARDAGLPIYQTLKSGPQSRTRRIKRPLKDGTSADIYEAILLAIANTGPKSEITYDELRDELSTLLTDKVPQKHEITNALKQLTKISQQENLDSALDWDDQTNLLSVTAPFLRYYLRWQVAKKLTPL